jgi:hypothetical protein
MPLTPVTNHDNRDSKTDKTPMTDKPDGKRRGWLKWVVVVAALAPLGGWARSLSVMDVVSIPLGKVGGHLVLASNHSALTISRAWDSNELLHRVFYFSDKASATDPFSYIDIGGCWECSVYRFASGSDKLLDMPIISLIVPYWVIVVSCGLLALYLLFINHPVQRRKPFNQIAFQWGLIGFFPFVFFVLLILLGAHRNWEPLTPAGPIRLAALAGSVLVYLMILWIVRGRRAKSDSFRDSH